MSFDVSVTRAIGGRTLTVAFRRPGRLIALSGPSGAGKTSVLNMIAGLIQPADGRIVIDGHVLFDAAARIDLPVRQRRAGYVFQEARLFPHMTVRDNLLFGWRLARAEERWMAFDEMTAFLGITALVGRWPATLSGGEAQRVAIGRALLSGPRFLLLDEPLASLDDARRADIVGVIERIRDELAIPIIHVTHDQRELRQLVRDPADIIRIEAA